MQVHETHRYPIRRPDDPKAWLVPDGEIGAWVAERDSEVVGHVCLTSSDGARELLMVQRLFVEPTAGGRGVGRTLLDHVTAVARERGAQLALEVANNNRAAINLYRRAGWLQTGRRSAPWGGDVASHVLLFNAPYRPR